MTLLTKIPLTSYSKEIGNLGEQLAQKYLLNKGYQIIAKNFCIVGGQIDIICRNSAKFNRLIFFEVKTRTGKSFGEAEESISWHQKNSLIKTAQTYLSQHALLHCSWQFDLISIDLNLKTKTPQAKIRHLQNIFTE